MADISSEWAKEIRSNSEVTIFRQNGGAQTLKSYRVEMIQDLSSFTLLGDLSQKHITFLQQTQLYYELGKFVFVHGGINPYLPLSEQNPYVLLWEGNLGGAADGQTLVIGHTPTPPGEEQPLVADDLIMLDTGASYGRSLSAMDILSGQVWQAKA